jgi:hypothetical protein
MRGFLFVFVLFLSFAHGFDGLTELVASYQRNFTVVELSPRDHSFSLDLAVLYPRSTFVIIVAQEQRAQVFVEAIKRSHLKNVVVLRPSQIKDEDIKILSRCEYPDILISHDIHGKLSKGNYNTLQALKMCGDHLFVVAPSSWRGHAFIMEQQPDMFRLDDHLAWYYFACSKKGLDIARWNLTKMGEAAYPRYEIVSNFSEKTLCKGPHRTPWHPGINLMTGLYIGFYYPNRLQLMEHMKRYYRIQHNDLVIGNFIMTGEAILPIDFNDPRRNIDARICVHAAVSLLKEDPVMEPTENQVERYNKKLMSRLQRLKAKLIKP